MDQAKFKEGIALFKEGHFFEAHEVWEEIWLKDRYAEEGKMLKGLILYAASCLKQRQGQRGPALRLAQSALHKLEGLETKTAAAWNLDLNAWLKKIKAFLAASSSSY